MSKPFVKRREVYGHPEDPTFETEDPQHALAFAKVYPMKSWLRARLNESGRFQKEKMLEGALQRDFDLLVEYEMRGGCNGCQAKSTPVLATTTVDQVASYSVKQNESAA